MRKKINFPVIRHDPFPPRVLSMDEYLKFVEFNLLHVFDKRSSDAQKKKQRVLVPFILRP
jgi:hypothetical protein